LKYRETLCYSAKGHCGQITPSVVFLGATRQRAEGKTRCYALV
jgi:hypothetical protein